MSVGYGKMEERKEQSELHDGQGPHCLTAPIRILAQRREGVGGGGGVGDVEVDHVETCKTHITPGTIRKPEFRQKPEESHP